MKRSSTMAASSLVAAGLGGCSANQAPGRYDDAPTAAAAATMVSPTLRRRRQNQRTRLHQSGMRAFQRLYKEYAGVSAGDTGGVYLESEEAKDTNAGDVRGLLLPSVLSPSIARGRRAGGSRNKRSKMRCGKLCSPAPVAPPLEDVGLVLVSGEARGEEGNAARQGGKEQGAPHRTFAIAERREEKRHREDGGARGKHGEDDHPLPGTNLRRSTAGAESDLIRG